MNNLSLFKIAVRAIHKDCPIVFFVIDQEGRFQISEGRGLERFGLNPGQIVGLTVYELYKNTHPEYIHDFLKCLYEEGEFWSDTFIESPGGGAFAYKTLYKRIEQDGEAVVLGIAFDYTIEQEAIRALSVELKGERALSKELTKAITIKERVLNTFSRKKVFAVSKIMYAIFGGLAIIYQILRILDIIKPLF